MTRILFRKKWEFNATNANNISKKLKMFSQFCTAFLKSRFSFGHFEEKDEPHSLYYSEVIDGERCGYVNVRRVTFQYTLA